MEKEQQQYFDKVKTVHPNLLGNISPQNFKVSSGWRAYVSALFDSVQTLFPTVIIHSVGKENGLLHIYATGMGEDTAKFDAFVSKMVNFSDMVCEECGALHAIYRKDIDTSICNSCYGLSRPIE